MPPGGSMGPRCFLTFIKWKITKLLITQPQLKLVKNKRIFGILRNFNNIFTLVWLNLQIIEFYLIKYVVTIIITMIKVSKTNVTWTNAAVINVTQTNVSGKNVTRTNVVRTKC